jgi:hypothetical protein
MVATGSRGTPLDGTYDDSACLWPNNTDDPVIHLLPPLTLTNRFSVQDLPDPLQLPLLQSMVTPRIVSSSMTPTIQAGDRLELDPPTSLAVGAIVVFRHDTQLVCHRIAAIDTYGRLSTRGDAMQGSCEVVQPGSVIGTVIGVVRNGIHLSFDQSPRKLSAAVSLSSLMSRIRSAAVQSMPQSVRVLTRFSPFRLILATLFRWTATVDAFTPAPLQSFPSLSKVASVTLRMFPLMSGLLAASIEQKPTRYMIRLGSWRLAQYDPTTETLLLRQPLRDAGLESIFRQIFSACQRT